MLYGDRNSEIRGSRGVIFNAVGKLIARRRTWVVKVYLFDLARWLESNAVAV